MNLNQVTLPSLSIAESVAFYQQMGFLQIVEDTHYARFLCTLGNATFSLHKVEQLAPESNTIIYFETETLDEQVRALQAKGMVFFQEPRDESWLWREARLYDPSHNVICLYFAGENRINPPWRINP
jgi:catechol 2,3-dioxygenase-like lactoylglutathione lyase family enzyme